MSRSQKGSKRGYTCEAHVRLYRHELECLAYRSMSTEARALLVELRALYSPANGDNKVFCGVRRIMQRCNLSQRAAMRARDELVEKGWIALLQLGAFRMKVRHASVFALENEPPNTGNGSKAGNAFMRWQPSANPPRTIAAKKIGSQIDYRTVAESPTDKCEQLSTEPVTVAESTTVDPVSSPCTVAESTTQIGLPPEGDLSAGSTALDPSMLTVKKRRGAA